MVASAAIHARMRSVWERVGSRFSAYQLVLPGTPGFVCDASACAAQCCRAFSVNLGEREAERFARMTGKAPADFLECEGGEPIALPLAQPYVLARSDGQCRQLSQGLGCMAYAGRPNACRLYPHFIVAIEPASGRPVHGDIAGIATSVRSVQNGAKAAPYVPLLLRHTDCPGSTGPAMTEADWWALFDETFRLQYEAG